MAAFQLPSDPVEASPWVNHQGQLPPEVDIEGNIEYKLKLVATAPDRFEHLVTQLKWRLSEGRGSAIYEIGVADDGSFVGLSPQDMEQSLKTLHRMADFLKADVTILRRVSVESTQQQHPLQDQDQDTLATTTVPNMARKASLSTHSGSPRTEPEYLVVEAKVTSRLADEHHFLEIRVALVGGPDAGKSTLLGRLAHGIADNGRGKARLNLLRHRHEISTGRTSSISHEIMGFTAKGHTVNYNTTNISSWQEICEASAKVVTLLDTCGHPRFLKTTISGLTGHSPDYASLVVDSRVGGVSEMTKEHLALAVALGLPTFVAVTKMDVATRDQLRATVTGLMALIRATGPSCLPTVHLDAALNSTLVAGPRIGGGHRQSAPLPVLPKFVPVIVHNEKDLFTIVKRFSSQAMMEESNTVAIPILLLSSVTSENVNLLEKFLFLLPKPGQESRPGSEAQDPACYQIEEIYNIPDIGTVVGGFLHTGRIQVQQAVSLQDHHHHSSQPPLDTLAEEEEKIRRLYLGPVDRDGSFIPVVVKSIHRQRMSMRAIDAGHTATLAIDGPGLSRVKVRRGMVVLESDTDPHGTCCQKFEAVIQVLAHEGLFGVGFQGMIHCGSVHQNAKVIRINLLPGPDPEDGSTVAEDDLGPVEATRTITHPTTTTTPSTTFAPSGRDSVQSLRSSSPSSDYGSGTGSSLPGSVPISRSNSMGQHQSLAGGGGVGVDDPGSHSDEAILLPPTLPLSSTSASQRIRHRQESTLGMIPISTMRTFQRLSVKADSSCTSSATPHPHQKDKEEEDAVVQEEEGDYNPDVEEQEETEDQEDSFAELSEGSRARVVFRFCHEVVFMREGTTVLFRHGRTKCVGKVLRML